MAMHLIIDGYNLLAVMGGGGRALLPSERARESLLLELAAYRQRKGHAITVVFDGWQQGQPIEGREHRAGIQVIYSKRGERADQVIQRLARDNGADCAVVSSDHEIVNHAKAHGAFVMGAQEFSDKIRLRAQSGSMLVNKELDTGDDVPASRGPDKKGNPRKLPKAQRKRSKQLRRF